MVSFYHNVFWGGVHEQLESFRPPIGWFKMEGPDDIFLKFLDNMGRKRIRRGAVTYFCLIAPTDCPSSLSSFTPHTLLAISLLCEMQMTKTENALLFGELFLRINFVRTFLLMQRLVAFWRNLSFKKGIYWCINSY